MEDTTALPGGWPATWGDPRITLDQFRTFVAIADTGSFHRAAELLHRSQPTVTHKLKQLEEVLGTTLLSRRQGHVLSLTDVGARFLTAARDALRHAALAVQTIREPNLRGQVRVGVPSDTLSRVTPALVARAARTHPALEIVITTGLSSHLLREYERENVDVLLFKMREGRPPPLPARPLGSEPLHWVASTELHIDELPVVPLVTFHEGCVYRAAAIDSLSRVNQRWKVMCSTGEFENVRSAISAGLGVSALPCSAVAGNHVLLDEQHGFPPLPRVQLLITARKHAEDPLFEHVTDLLVEAWREQPARSAAPSPITSTIARIARQGPTYPPAADA